MKRYNPTRRGGIPLDRCLCGWSRKAQKFVSNGCKCHPNRGKEAHAERRAA